MNYESAVRVAHTELLLARKLVSEQIARYPAPISGCDAQFNGLLSDRVRISDAIRSLESQPFIPTPRQLHAGDAVERR